MHHLLFKLSEACQKLDIPIRNQSYLDALYGEMENNVVGQLPNIQDDVVCICSQYGLIVQKKSMVIMYLWCPRWCVSMVT